jgi:hypothetical protein
MASAQNVLAVDDGRTALDLANAAGLAAARSRETRATVMLSAQKTLTDSNRASANFARRKSRDRVRGGKVIADSNGTRGAANFTSKYPRDLGLSNRRGASFGFTAGGTTGGF